METKEKKIWSMSDENLDRLFEASNSKRELLAEYYKDRPESYEIRYSFGLGTYTMEVYLIYGES